jgi:hypothetical protein
VNEAQVRVPGGEALGQFQGPIGAAVLHHEDLGRVGLLFQESKYLLQRAGQAAFLVVGGDDDGEQRDGQRVYGLANRMR